MTDYSELEGKEVIVTNRYCPEDTIGIVFGCDYDIGITIQEKETKRYLFCLRGLSSPNRDPNIERYEYNDFFKTFISMIRNGVINERILSKKASETVGNGSEAASSRTCPFAQ